MAASVHFCASSSVEKWGVAFCQLLEKPSCYKYPKNDWIYWKLLLVLTVHGKMGTMAKPLCAHGRTGATASQSARQSTVRSDSVGVVVYFRAVHWKCLWVALYTLSVWTNVYFSRLSVNSRNNLSHMIMSSEECPREQDAFHSNDDRTVGTSHTLLTLALPFSHITANIINYFGTLLEQCTLRWTNFPMPSSSIYSHYLQRKLLLHTLSLRSEKLVAKVCF